MDNKHKPKQLECACWMLEDEPSFFTVLAVCVACVKKT